MTDTAEVKTRNMETHSALPPEETERLGGEIVAALKTVFDPEIPADIYELGLIYKVDIKDDRTVDVVMTLTTPNCPAAGELPQMVENAVASVPGVGVVNVNLVWEPAWTPDRITELTKRADSEIVGLRVGIKNGGCAGQSYTVEYAHDVRPTDEVVEDKGVKILVDPKAVLFLLGTEMDYKVDKMSAQFIFNNPNQTGACGCGESVQLTAAKV